ncbi:MAG: hypothetical protein EOO28_05715 [Comamonadaceae bacterium]|nr:MAG: hypothetical protein EOO28_05715 [Comamonadaceae bacterium]
MNTKTKKLPKTAPALLCSTLLAALGLMVAVPAEARGYTPKGTCEGFPKVDIKAPAGFCVALVADERQGLKFPRRMVEVAPNRFWIVDMGGWTKGAGKLFEMTLKPGGAAPELKTLASGLDRPHGLAIGPDGKAYVAEATRILRSPTSGWAQEVVIDKLPGDGSHPLKEIAFGGKDGGKLYVNVGSFSDSCKNDAQQQPQPCPEVQGDKPRAAVYEAVLGKDGALQSFKPFATGLRNSMALAVYQQAGQPDIVLQGENSIDYPDVGVPHEELNILQAGGNYGWPYCVENQQPARGYEKYDCKPTKAPAALWPAHTAPLQMLVAPAGSLPWSGQLVVAWHGYKPAGQRVMAFKLDGAGKPAGSGTEILGNWTAQTGVRPQGAPTGVTVGSDGRLFVLEDRNRTLLMLGRENKP